MRIMMEKTLQTHNTYNKTRLQNRKKNSRKLNQQYTIEHKINSFKQEDIGSGLTAVGFNLQVALEEFP